MYMMITRICLLLGLLIFASSCQSQDRVGRPQEEPSLGGKLTPESKGPGRSPGQTEMFIFAKLGEEPETRAQDFIWNQWSFIEDCFKQSLKLSQGASTRVSVKLVFTAKATLKEVQWLESQPVGDRRLRRCLIKEFRALAWPTNWPSRSLELNIISGDLVDQKTRHGMQQKGSLPRLVRWQTSGADVKIYQ